MKVTNRLKSFFVFAGLLTLCAFSQLVPFGRDHTNPPVFQEPKWDSSITREFTRRACFDCHSNETTYPWYANFAPVSWLMQIDLNTARFLLNFSEWGHQQVSNESILETIEKRDMPSGIYLLQHPAAYLDQAELDLFIKGMRATLGVDH